MPPVQWSNERIMEFLEIYQTEPSLWDPKKESYKNRGAQNEAWQRIRQGLQFPSTVDELKKKKESLMSYYRINFHKYKKSLSTSWFAFDLMHSFLKPVYEGNKISGTQSRESESEASEGHENSCHGVSPVLEPMVKSKLKRTNHSQLDNHNPGEQHCFSTKKQKRVSTPAKQIAASFDSKIAKISNIATQGLDEYDHFALMIAAKIRKINDVYERESVMNTIQNIVFKSVMKNNNDTCQEATDTLQTECWVTSNNEYDVEIDTKTNIPLYCGPPRSPSPESD